MYDVYALKPMLILFRPIAITCSMACKRHSLTYTFILLFISYTFVNGFIAITFLLRFISGWNFHDMRQGLLCTAVVRNEISASSDKRQRLSPSTPIVKISHFGYVMSIDMTLPKWAILTMGVYVEFVFGRILLKCRFWLHKKRWDTSWKFQPHVDNRSN